LTRTKAFLKYHEFSANGAIDQIREKQYPDALKGYGGKALPIGIGYDKNAESGKRKHICRIEKVLL